MCLYSTWPLLPVLIWMYLGNKICPGTSVLGHVIVVGGSNSFCRLNWSCAIATWIYKLCPLFYPMYIIVWSCNVYTIIFFETRYSLHLFTTMYCLCSQIHLCLPTLQVFPPVIKNLLLRSWQLTLCAIHSLT
jgi:hypothetical protein